jgi:predicted GNAT superfamily acetyltransferase
MIAVREVVEHSDLAEAVRLQKIIWGFEEIDLLPFRLFVVATKVGGQVIGAFDDERMVGFALAIPGIKPGGLIYLHSHMTGVIAEYRDRGVGRMLKLRQRHDALARGIDLIEWTFDPLELKNAFFNIERLGAVVRRYVQNQYGTTSSHLHGGLPTDRCVAEWHLASPHVQRVLEGSAEARDRTIAGKISVPIEIGELRTRDPQRARQIQRQVTDEFTGCLSRGLAVVGFEKTHRTGNYLLATWDSK